jgi:hypothetical protein
MALLALSWPVRRWAADGAGAEVRQAGRRLVEGGGMTPNQQHQRMMPRCHAIRSIQARCRPERNRNSQKRRSTPAATEIQEPHDDSCPQTERRRAAASPENDHQHHLSASWHILIWPSGDSRFILAVIVGEAVLVEQLP